MSKNSMYKFDKKNIQGGAGRLIVGEDTTKRPDKISDVMDLETFELKEGYKDLGATTEGIQQSRGFETEDVEIDQSTTPIDTSITNWTNAISTTLMETHTENRQLAMCGGSIKETAATLVTGTKLSAAIAKDARLLKVTSAADFKEGGFAKIADETIQIASISNNIITLKKGVSAPVEADADVTPIKELGTKAISYGAPSSIPAKQLVLISQREDGTFLMIVYYEVKLNGDSVETTFDKNKRTMPIGFVAFAQDDLPEDENVFKEIEQVI